LIDEYSEDWTKLYFIMIQGEASIIGGKKLELGIIRKIINYSTKNIFSMKIGVGGYVIMIDPKKVISWMNV